MHKIVIIDDESGARKTISAIIKNYTKEFDIVAEADDVDSGVLAIIKNKPDIVMLDINLSSGTGFDILKQLPETNFKLIFITAYNEYAIKAIKYSAFDYILKPVDASELIQTLNKIDKTSKENFTGSQLKTFFENVSENKKKKIILKTSESIYIVDVDNVVYCKSDNNYTEFYLSDGKKILVSNTLKHYETTLNKNIFVRTHQSYLVNTQHIITYKKRDGGYLVLSNNHQIPVSASKKQLVFNAIEKMV